MTKNISIFFCIFTTLLQGMKPKSLHKRPKQNFTLISHGTTINLVENWKDIRDTTDIIVTGNHHQVQSEQRANHQYKPIGTIFISCYGTHKKKSSQLIIMDIEEPYLTQSKNELQRTYYVLRKNQSYREYSDYQNNTDTFVGDKAIQEASQDLAFCYTAALKKGLEILNNKSTKRITFTPLSTKVGFPRDTARPIVIETIFAFIQKNPGYNSINLIITNFARYKLLLLQHSGILHNICLFYHGHQDSGSTLVVLPRELIPYIVSLI